MKKITIFYNPNKEEALAKSQDLAKAFKSFGIEAKISQTQKTSDNWGALDKDTDLAIAMGGDGTLLLAAKQVLELGIPLLGVNFGHLGFLSEYGDIEMQDLAKEIAAANLIIQSRSILQAQLPERKFYALNDISLNRSPSANLLYTDLYIDNDLVHSFRSDGIVISTPTGSTAYALSAGGAVMDPNISAFQIVPIAAHSLNSRAHVVSDLQTIVLETEDNQNNFYMQVDGQDLIELKPGTRISFSKAAYSLKLVKLKSKERSFYSILRDKMKWGAINN